MKNLSARANNLAWSLGEVVKKTKQNLSYVDKNQGAFLYDFLHNPVANRIEQIRNHLPYPYAKVRAYAYYLYIEF